MEQPKYIVFDKRETVAESLVKDGVTFALLLLCIWASLGSTWWTFFTAVMFLVFLGAKAAMAVGSRQKKFTSLDDMQAWIEQERSNTRVKPPRQRSAWTNS